MCPKTFFDIKKLLLKNQQNKSTEKTGPPNNFLEFFSAKVVKILEKKSDGKVSTDRDIDADEGKSPNNAMVQTL